MGAGIVLAMIIMTLVALIGVPSLVNTTNLLEKKQAREIVAVANGIIIQRQNYQFEYSKSLPIATWKEALNTQGAFVPYLQNVTLNYNQNINGAYFCYTIDSMDRRRYYHSVFNEVMNVASFNAFINDTCGASSNFSFVPDYRITDVTLTIYTGR